MSEVEFWTNFFESYYIRKDQINSKSNDLFADCAYKDDEELRNRLKRALTDPLDIIDSQKNFSNEDVVFFSIKSFKIILSKIYILIITGFWFDRFSKQNDKSR